jgi:hypothetical protein
MLDISPEPPLYPWCQSIFDIFQLFSCRLCVSDSHTIVMGHCAANVGIACVGGQDPAYTNKVFATEQDFAQVRPHSQTKDTIAHLCSVCVLDIRYNRTLRVWLSIVIQLKQYKHSISSSPFCFSSLVDVCEGGA